MKRSYGVEEVGESAPLERWTVTTNLIRTRQSSDHSISHPPSFSDSSCPLVGPFHSDWRRRRSHNLTPPLFMRDN